MKFKRLLVSTLICTWWGNHLTIFNDGSPPLNNADNHECDILIIFCKICFLLILLQGFRRWPPQKEISDIYWSGPGCKKKLLGCTLFLSHRLFSFLIDSSLGKLFSSKNIKMQWPKDIPIQFYITITILPIFQTTISSSNGWWLVDGCHQNIGCGYKLFSVSTMFLYWHSLTNAMDNCSWNVSI